MTEHIPYMGVHIHSYGHRYLEREDHSKWEFPLWQVIVEGADKVYLVPPLCPLPTPPKEDSPHECLSIFFSLDFPCNKGHREAYPCTLTHNLHDKIIRIEQLLAERENPIAEVECSLLTQALVCEALLSIDAALWYKRTQNAKVSKAIHHIKEHYAEALSNKSLADLVCMTTNAFGHLFKKEVGIPLHQYIQELRVEKARHLLMQTNKSIDEVASDTGFANRFHFSRIFQQIMRISPVQYRSKQ
jgi:AraC-like DNA-binding protein